MIEIRVDRFRAPASPSAVVELGANPPTLDDATQPACFSRAHLDNEEAFEVTLEFRTAQRPAADLTVTAVPDPRGSNVLGTIERFQLRADDWDSNNRQRVTVPIVDHRLGQAAVSASTVIWNWKFVDESGSVTTAATSHRVFVILDQPDHPWAAGGDQAAELDTLPWPAVLEIACTWAVGATSEVEAATRVTAAVFELGWEVPGRVRLRYRAGDQSYVTFSGTPLHFHCEVFLADIAGARPAFVNCIGASSIVTTFSNIVGCRLRPIVIDAPDCNLFKLNPIVPLGGGTTEDEFVNHVVAASGVKEGRSLEDALVFDAALTVDADAQPSSPPRSPAQAGLRVGRTSDSLGSGAYLPQLVHPSTPSCTLHEFTFPWVVRPADVRNLDSCTLVRFERYRNALRDGAPSVPSVFKSFVIGGFTPRDVQLVAPGINRVPSLPRAPDLTRTILTSVDDPEVALEVLVENAATVADSISTVAEWLARAQTRPVRRQTARGPLFVLPNNAAAYGLWDGRAVAILNRGDKTAPLAELLTGAQPV